MDTELLKAPLEHVKRQFRQNCYFQFDGALFLSTPSFLRLVSEYSEPIPKDSTSSSVILLDHEGLPVVLDAASLLQLYRKAQEVLSVATNTYLSQKALCASQFAKKLQLEPLPNEETE